MIPSPAPRHLRDEEPQATQTLLFKQIQFEGAFLQIVARLPLVMLVLLLRQAAVSVQET